jgi:hypothetical protein
MKSLIASTVSIIIVLLILAIIGLSQNKPQTTNVFGGLGNDPYSYKHISSTNASSTVGTLVRGGPGVLGSITINTTSAHVVRVYDGSTTATTSGTLIASIKASTAEQTLNYDVSVTKGVVLDVPAGYTGSITITTK